METSKQSQEMPLLSIIIPIAPKETEWNHLLRDLHPCPKDTEIIFVISHKSQILKKHEIKSNKKVSWVMANPGRASHLNTGAKEAVGEYIWFLHADTKVESHTISRLLNILKTHPKTLLYCDLVFINKINDSKSKKNNDTPLIKLNQWGANLRSKLLGLPFGDQGYCIKRSLFHQVGNYPEDIGVGEDHLWVWKAKQQGIPVQSIGAPVYTSNRKYKTHGWLKTTIKHQMIWIKQAWPEWKKLNRMKQT